VSSLVMENKEDYDVTSRATPELEVSTGQIRNIDNENVGIKRDLSSRHINMIAIAGMIVRQRSICRGFGTS
jgi:amino acid transporter